MFGRRQLAVLMAEFLGTGVLSLVVLSVEHSSIGLPYFVALAAGLVLAALTVTFAGSGAAHFNPAITIGMWTTRQIKTLPAACFIVVQMLGAWVAYYLYIYISRGSIQPIGGKYDSHVLVAEALGTFVFALAWAAVVFGRAWNAKAAAVIGGTFTVAIIIASSASIGIVNPAVALSVRAFDVFGSMGWLTYALGPVVGAVIGFNLYALLFTSDSTLQRLVRTGVNGGLRGGSSATTAKTVKAPAKAAKTTKKRSARAKK